MGRRKMEQAYVTTCASSFVRSGRPLSASTCAHPTKPRRRLAAKWRCTLTEEGVESGADGEIGNPEPRPEAPGPPDLDPSNPPEVEENLPFIPVEGELTMDVSAGLDAGLEAALSKSWGKLASFGDKGDGMALAGKHKTLSDEVREGQNGDNLEPSEAEDGLTESPVTNTNSEGEHANQDGDIEAGKGKSVSEQDAPEDVVFLKPAEDLASDAVIESIAAAKKGIKKKRTTKKATTKKAKATTKKPKIDAKESNKPEMTRKELLDSEEWSPDPRWFFVQVKPGCEQSCSISIRNMAQSLHIEILDVLVPTTKIMRLTKSGKSVEKEERLFPSYILVLMAMNRHNYSEILRIPNVQWFMGDPNRDKGKDQPFRPPLPVSDSEMKNVFTKVKEAGSSKPQVKTEMRPGDTIQVIAGSFEGSMGTVTEVKPDINVVVARLRVFARETSTELEMHMVKIVHSAADEGEPPKIPEKGKKGSKSVKEDTAKEAPSAGLASAADNLAQLLSDTPDEGDEDFAGMFTTDTDDFGLADAKRRPRNNSLRRRNEPPESTTESQSAAEELSKLFGDDSDEDGMKFFDELEEENKRSREEAKDINKNTSQDPLISSDGELAAFLSNEDSKDLWEPSETTPSTLSSDEDGDRTAGSKAEAEEDDLFAFLDDDDFEEADILPDEKPVSKGSTR